MLGLILKYKSFLIGGIVILVIVIGVKIVLDRAYEHGVMAERLRIQLENKNRQIQSSKITEKVQSDFSKEIIDQNREFTGIEAELGKVRIEESKDSVVIIDQDNIDSKLDDLKSRKLVKDDVIKVIKEKPVNVEKPIQYVLVPVEQDINIARAEIKALWDTFCVDNNPSCVSQ